MKEWINEWYNDQFDKIDLTPSSNVWDNISQTMEDWPKHWYASNVNDLGTKPRQSAWEHINTQLADQRRVQRSNRISYVAAAIISFFLIVVPFSTEDSFISSSNKNMSLAKLDNRGDDIEFSASGQTGSEANYSRSTIKKVNSVENNGSVERQVVSGDEQAQLEMIIIKRVKPRLSSKSTLEESLSKDQYQINTLPILSSTLPDQRVSDELRINNNKSRYSWLAVSLMPQLSTLNNPLSQTAMSSDETDILFQRSMTYSISAGYQFSNRNGIKLALLLNNRKSLTTASEGSERTIDLNYVSLAASYTSSWDLGRKDRFSFNTAIGVIGGYSTSQSVSFNNERISSLEEGYGNFDIGTMLGASISTKLSDHLSLNTGINTQLGLTNIFRGNDVVPSDFFRTTTQSVGLNIGLQYNL